jgi:phosphate starvation-inducible PhoH-like protein
MSKNNVGSHQRANKIVIQPKNSKQQEYIRALHDYSQVFAIGPAGSGKTYIPTMMAVKAYLRGEIDKIILTRPAVAVQEEHGFLPGNLEKKLAPWVLPVTELIEEALGSKQKFLDMLKSGDLEIAPFTYMRGRTFKDAFVFLDEAQNTTPEQMEMFLTRLGENSRVVISGDIRQSDMKHNSGLRIAVDLARQYKIPAGIIEFTSEDVVRSNLCQQWVKAFEKTLHDA